jgi:hypothetical protein
LHFQKFIPHLVHGPFQGRRSCSLRDVFFFSAFFILPLDKPSLDIAHALLQCANVSNGPFLELLKPPCDYEEGARNIERTLFVELRIERRWLTGWRTTW